MSAYPFRDRRAMCIQAFLLVLVSAAPPIISTPCCGSGLPLTDRLAAAGMDLFEDESQDMTLFLLPGGEQAYVTLTAGDVILFITDSANARTRTGQFSLKLDGPDRMTWEGSFDGIPAKGWLVCGVEGESVIAQGRIGQLSPFRMTFKLMEADAESRIASVEVSDVRPFSAADEGQDAFKITTYLLGFDGVVRQSSAQAAAAAPCLCPGPGKVITTCTPSDCTGADVPCKQLNDHDYTNCQYPQPITPPPTRPCGPKGRRLAVIQMIVGLAFMLVGAPWGKRTSGIAAKGDCS